MAIENRAAFYLKDFEIPEFKFLSIGSLNNDEVAISFKPSGKFSKKEKVFYLTLNFKLFEKSTENDYIKAKVIGHFGFENVESFEDIPSFFYKNSIAILYPYLRSFVSSVTLQANIKNVILPTMNLSSLEPELKNSSKAVD